MEGMVMAIDKNDLFFNYLYEMSANLHESARCLADYKVNNISDLKDLFEKIKQFELKGDSLVSELIGELHKVFITPIEREDILSLTMKLDNVIDGFEHTAALFEMYSIIETDDYMKKFVEELRKSTAEIMTAVKLLQTKKLLSIRPHLIEIKDIESNCDLILRDSIQSLFTTEKDPIRIIQYKEIYHQLENIADFCQEVANTLEAIIMKNA
jgi:predicted phosphate transport protein (TIGR00153 family)